MRPGRGPLARILADTAEDLACLAAELRASTWDGLVCVAGAPGSGKTALHIVLAQAARNLVRDARRPQVSYRPLSRATANLEVVCGETIDTGRIGVNASLGVQEHEFELTIRLPGSVFSRRTVTASFRTYDGPGGALIGPADPFEPDRERLLQAAREAKGLFLCIDPCAPDLGSLLFKELPRTLGELGLEKLPFDRVAVCLTKADRLFSGKRSALSDAIAASPFELARRLLGDVTLKALASYCRPETQIGFVLTSTYGFLEDEGTANYDPRADSLLHSLEGGYRPDEIAGDWRPFQVLDPFVFLSTGWPGGMQVVEAEEVEQLVARC